MARFDDLVDDVRQFAAECPDTEIVNHLRKAAIEFCKRSRFWREVVEIPLTAEVEYEMPAIDLSGRALQIVAAQYRTDDSPNGGGHRRIHIRIAKYAEVRMPEGRDYFSEPSEVGLRQDGRTVRVWPVPLVDGLTNPRLDLRIAVGPQRNARQFPDEIEEQWRDALVDGAIYMLARIPRKPWTSVKVSQERRFEFYRQINQAARERINDGGQTHTRMRPWA